MFDCPNCGEPVSDNASFCSHCGSDAETGWKPDVDYYSIEIPDDPALEDEEFDSALDGPPPYPDESAIGLRNLLGPGVIVFCFALFVSVGYRRHDLWIILPAIFLMVMALVFLRTPGRPHTRRRRT